MKSIIAFCVVAIGLLFLLATHSYVRQSGIPPSGSAEIDHFRQTHLDIYLNDFGQTGYFRQQNSGLESAPPTMDRVVFFGDSIISGWQLPHYFPDKPAYVNRGIIAQTSSQFLVRFRQDVIELHPKAIIIQATNNDFTGATGPMRLEDSEANYASMAELAKAHGIRVIIASVMPVHNHTQESLKHFAARPMEKIRSVNSWLKDYCKDNHIIYIDYFSNTLDTDGLLAKSLSHDGLHPNDAGYKRMVPLAEKAVKQALAQ